MTISIASVSIAPASAPFDFGGKPVATLHYEGSLPRDAALFVGAPDGKGDPGVPAFEHIGASFRDAVAEASDHAKGNWLVDKKTFAVLQAADGQFWLSQTNKSIKTRDSGSLGIHDKNIVADKLAPELKAIVSRKAWIDLRDTDHSDRKALHTLPFVGVIV